MIVFRCGFLLLLLVFATPGQLGAARIVERRVVFISGSDHGDCEGFLSLPHGRSRKASLVDCLWLVDPHLVLVVRHMIAG